MKNRRLERNYNAQRIETVYVKGNQDRCACTAEGEQREKRERIVLSRAGSSNTTIG